MRQNASPAGLERAPNRVRGYAGERPRPARVRVVVITRGTVLALLTLVAGVQQLSHSGSREIEANDVCNGLGGCVQTLNVSTDGRTLVACSSDGMLTAWEPGSFPAQTSARVKGGEILQAASAPNAMVLALAGLDDCVALCDLAAGRKRQLPLEASRIRRLAVSPDGGLLAVADDVRVRLLDVSGRRASPRPAFDVHGVTNLAFSPDARLLAIGCRDGMVRIGNPGETNLRHAIPAHAAPVTALAFSSDGRALASGSHAAYEVNVWSPAQGNSLARFTNPATVQALAFVPGEPVIAVAGGDGTVRLWGVSPTALPRTVLRHDGPVTALAFSVDRTILACGGMGSLSVYRFDELSGSRTR